MSKVFIGGSRRVSRLNKDVKRRLDNIIDRGFTIMVGDANGADKAVQRYLSSRRYPNVVVFCMVGECRNNIGNWPTRDIAAPLGTRGFTYFSTKDRAMAEEADYGLMLWDGKSRGTLTSIVDLVRHGRPVVVYVSPARTFATLREPEQLATLVGRFDPGILHRVERDLHASTAARSERKADAILF
ncbi:MAG TPA: hypothetical protein VGQ71_12675 [Terriglobales bacterium]|jgi:hypothetical protein|nr:hypothetical protein [Terriglobales bacterium]